MKQDYHASPAEMSDTLITALQGHDHYFARVIDTIPSDLYKHTVSEDADGAQEGKYAKVLAVISMKDEKQLSLLIKRLQYRIEKCLCPLMSVNLFQRPRKVRSMPLPQHP